MPMKRETLVQAGAAALCEIYRAGVSYRKLRIGAAAFVKALSALPPAEANFAIGILDSAMLRGEAMAGQRRRETTFTDEESVA